MTRMVIQSIQRHGMNSQRQRRRSKIKQVLPVSVFWQKIMQVDGISPISHGHLEQHCTDNGDGTFTAHLDSDEAIAAMGMLNPRNGIMMF